MRAPYTRLQGIGRSGVHTFMYRRFLNLVIIVDLTSSPGYFLAAIALDPWANFEARNPPIPGHCLVRSPEEMGLRQRIRALAVKYPRYGYIRIMCGQSIFSSMKQLTDDP